ncbi:MAG: tRNA (adenosine(37)-N6)-threonylcarbamoyltransferase complex dimerization subunit type 1 TsaB [Arenicella sp.]|nr:tRNA (adenosine(37)-N6)-threonylcarbamoyltransferase complex dimerization subunit type 1 TsaB [Arenicella sp.]
MSTILAIETATPSCSAALRIDGEVVVRAEVGNNIHSQVLLGMIESLLAEAQLGPQALDAVTVGQGPGSFTGLRIGVGVGQGLAFGANCPMIGVSSLDALALQALGDNSVIAAIDARMGEVYWCEYQKIGDQIKRLSGLQVTPPTAVKFSNADVRGVVVGSAWSAYPNQFSALNEWSAEIQSSIVYPSAGSLLRLAEEQYRQRKWLSAALFAPMYVRNDVAKKSTKKLPGRRPE